MSKPFRYVLFGALLIVTVTLIAACGDDDDDGGGAATGAATETADQGPATIIAVALADFSVSPDPASAPSGEITFAAQNTGATPHELLVIRTDLAPDGLPTDGTEVDESQLDVVLRIDEFPTGQSIAATDDLEPGSYVLICNIPGHYTLGMTAGFTVE